MYWIMWLIFYPLRRTGTAPNTGSRARQTGGGAGSMFRFYSGDDSLGKQM